MDRWLAMQAFVRIVESGSFVGAAERVGLSTSSLSRLVAQAATGQDVVEPSEVSGMAHLSATGVDEWATGLLRLPGDILATISCGIRLTREDGIRVFVDPKSYLYLMGSELRYEETLMASGFKLENPNVKSACGCGESFTV
mgnify:CR=1 FL=1